MDTTALAPTTELEAINDMLSLISESPVASLDEATRVADAQLALQLLSRESRAIQAKGWDWNREEASRFAPNIDKEILLPPNTVKVDATNDTIDVVYRNGKLWDRINKTFAFNGAVLLDVVYLLPFDELPETARRYIAIEAGRKFENRMIGDGGSHQINQTDVIQAWADLTQEECDNADLNVVRQSTTVRRIAHGRWRV